MGIMVYSSLWGNAGFISSTVVSQARASGEYRGNPWGPNLPKIPKPHDPETLETPRAPEAVFHVHVVHVGRFLN